MVFHKGSNISAEFMNVYNEVSIYYTLRKLSEIVMWWEFIVFYLHKTHSHEEYSTYKVRNIFTYNFHYYSHLKEAYNVVRLCFKKEEEEAWRNWNKYLGMKWSFRVKLFEDTNFTTRFAIFYWCVNENLCFRYEKTGKFV